MWFSHLQKILLQLHGFFSLNFIFFYVLCSRELAICLVLHLPFIPIESEPCRIGWIYNLCLNLMFRIVLHLPYQNPTLSFNSPTVFQNNQEAFASPGLMSPVLAVFHHRILSWYSLLPSCWLSICLRYPKINILEELLFLKLTQFSIKIHTRMTKRIWVSLTLFQLKNWDVLKKLGL
jgi:hypothetical protein